MMVSECLGSCYEQLPQPEMVLSPEDSELSYYLWMPGVQYQPRLQRKLSELRSITAETEMVPVDEVIEEVIAKDEFVVKFNGAASNGVMDLKTAADFVRELGGTPSQAELLEYCATNGNALTEDQVKELLAVSMNQKEDAAFLDNILQSLSRDKANINREHFEYIMSNYGEPLTPEELGAVRSIFFSSGDNIPCGELAAKLV
uniref:Myosin light chain n=1 Tax=Babesia sp. BQ1/Lintan TaxID=669259 RepID=K0A8V4_9APIC|nr:myosin light chain [Babesia sp. BQ1/Lintan]